MIPAPVREALAEHARDESPNEACGLVVVKDGVAERYVRGVNTAASPYRFELDVPEIHHQGAATGETRLDMVTLAKATARAVQVLEADHDPS